MSTTVVPAPAAKATRPVRDKKLANEAEKQAAAAAQEKDERVAEDNDQEEVVVAKAEGEEKEAPVSETSLAGDFSFDGALAEAAASAGSLVTDGEVGEDVDVSYAQYDDEGGSGGTILLVGAILLVGLGIAALASGGNDDNDIPVPPPPPPPPNEAPTVTVDADALTVDEDTSGTVTVTTDDADGDTVTVTGAADNGTVTVDGGTVTYAPDADFNGTDTVTITASDGNGGTATTTVTVTVNPVNDAPVFPGATASLSTDEETPVSGDLSTGTTDADGDTLTYAKATDPANGAVVVNADGTFTYTPETDFFGVDTFDVTVDDGNGGTATATVEVTVNNVNDAPVAGPGNDTSLTVATDETVNFVIDFNDADGDDVTASIASGPSNGTVTANADGTNTYDPDEGFIGQDMFDISVTDGTETVTYTVTVDVTAAGPTELSIDVPASGPAVTIDVSDDDYDLIDTVSGRTDVIITGFGEGDMISTDATQFFFGTGSDPSDLRITLSDGTNFNQIIIDDVLTGGLVFNYESAVASVGFDFINFG
ncbi:MAG: tandem-95 repeat protein [Sphingomonadaceae bacterium]